MICINKNSVEYQLLKERANINETVLEALCRYYVENYGRFPYLDELPDSNSIKYLREKLKITSNDGANINDILELSNASILRQLSNPNIFASSIVAPIVVSYFLFSFRIVFSNSV